MDDGNRVHPLGSIEELHEPAEEPDLVPLCTCALPARGYSFGGALFSGGATPTPTMPEVAGAVKVNHRGHRIRDRSQ
jgi:hypothetical protein